MTDGSPDEVWVDCDPALGLRFADVDDVLALVFLAASGARIAGLSTSWGNAPLPAVDRVARALARRLGIERVAAGASGPGDRDTAAAEALAAFRGTVLAIAPLTNVAAALARGARWRRLVVLGGTDRRLPNLRPLHTTELNFALDEPAAADVLAHGCDLVPMEPCRRVWFGRTELAALPEDLARGCRSWLWTSPLRTGRLAFHPWDLLAAAWVTDPDLVTVRRARAVPRPGPLIRGYVRCVDGEGRVLTRIDEVGLACRFVERVACWREGSGSA